MTDQELWLVVDDDAAFGQVLARSLQRRGKEAIVVESADAALAIAETPTHCVLDLNLDGQSSLPFIAQFKARWPAIEIVMLTGYGSIATAVEAVRLGASNYLCKPVTADQLLTAFNKDAREPDLRTAPPSIEELEWEHIQRVLAENDGNISATARALNMHRRTLQRKLAKHSRWRQ